MTEISPRPLTLPRFPLFQPLCVTQCSALLFAVFPPQFLSSAASRLFPFSHRAALRIFVMSRLPLLPVRSTTNPTNTRFHFASIAHDNASISTDIVTPPPTSPLHSAPSGSTITPPGVILCGTQKIHKFSHDPTGAPRRGHEDDVADTVCICLALFRVWLEPGLSGEASQGSSGESNGDLNASVYSGGRKKADVVVSVNINLSSADGKGEEEREKVQAWWESLVGSVKILDFGLFGDSD